MSSPCTKIVRGRVRGIASCFSICRLPIEEEEPHNSISSKRLCDKMSNVKKNPKAPTVCCGPTKVKRMSKKKDGEEQKIVENELPRSVNVSQGSGRVSEDGSESDPLFTKGDYIVFRLRKDGEIDLVNEGSDKSSDVYCDQNDQELVAHITTTHSEKLCLVDEEGSNEKESGDEEVKETTSANASNVESFESCESNLSDTSTSSFAFPQLGLDWIGSPVHMPKPENVRSLRLHCCSSS